MPVRHVLWSQNVTHPREPRTMLPPERIVVFVAMRARMKDAHGAGRADVFGLESWG
jgi:hypothetical protein